VRIILVKIFWGLAVPLLFCSCGTLRRMSYPAHHTYMPLLSENYGLTADYPQSYTVYPFKNTSWYQEAALRGQHAAHQVFSMLGPCASLQDTQQQASYPYSPEDALKVARKQGSDAVVLGEVVVQDHVFFILAAYSYVEMKISIYDTRDGKLLWQGGSWSMSGDLAGMYMWIPVPIAPMIEHVYWSRITSDLYHRICMDIVHKVRPDLIAP